jgi:chemotaxis protein histidine kinase CheA
MNQADPDFLQMYLQETDEQLTALTDRLLSWHAAPGDPIQVAEFFRLLHAIEGAAGGLGLESVLTLSRHIDRQAQRVRDSHRSPLSLQPSIDFLKTCNNRLRSGESLPNGKSLIEELGILVG